MGKKDQIKTHALEELKDDFIGKKGTAERQEYENELTLEVLGDMIKTIRKQRRLTQEELGKLIGVKKAQISKLESHARNVTVDTILRVFNALKAKVKFKIELDDNNHFETV